MSAVNEEQTEYGSGELPPTTITREDIGPIEAAHYLSLADRLNKNKSISNAHITGLTYKAKNGYWDPDSHSHLGAIFRGYGPNGPEWDWNLASGRHRFKMIGETGLTLPFIVTRRYFRTERDFIRWMLTFIDHGTRQHSGRAALLGVVGDQAGLRRADDVEGVGQAYGLIKSGFRRVETGISVEERERFVLDWAAEARAYENLIFTCPRTVRPRMMSQGVLAVLLVALRYQPERARIFIRGIALNEVVPGAMLNGVLLEQSAIPLIHTAVLRGDRVVWPGDERRRTVNRSERQPTTPAPVVAALVARGWRAFFQNRPLSTLVMPKLVLGTEGGQPSLPPITIAGTPYDGSVWLPYSVLKARE